MRSAGLSRVLLVALIVLAAAAPLAAEWQPFERLPRADRVRAAQAKMSRFPRDGRVSEVRWDEEADILRYRVGDAWFELSLTQAGEGAEPRAIEAPAAAARDETPRRRRPPVARGRQATRATSADGSMVAIHRDGNLYVAETAGGDEGGSQRAITTEGGGTLKFGSASWVYGEELDQNTAMWWSPDGARLAFYRFDDAPVREFMLLQGLATLRPSPILEAYPKPGEANPIAGLRIHDLAGGTTVEVDVGPETDQYVYGIEWTPSGDGILFRRTNRRQDTLDLVFADATTGAARVVLTETQPTWQKNSPEFRFLADGRRFLWETERSGFAHYEVRSLDDDAAVAVTAGDYPVESIVRVDEERGEVWYLARSGEIRITSQVHRARLDGSGSVRVTPGDLHWSNVRISPDGEFIVATGEFVDRPAESWLFDREGRKILRLAAGESDPWAAAGVSRPEFLSLLAADGVTPIYGILHKPSDYEAGRPYPLVVEAYGGPGISLISPRQSAGKPHAEFGALIVSVDNRGTTGRGKAFESANYLSLGEEDCDDQAAVVKQLVERGLVDPARVAIVGHSYGGFMALMGILRHPEVFPVAVAAAPVTDWRHYDTIYTERYMRTPQENPEGYDRFSAVKLAPTLKGRLLLLHGMVDDNVHPTNAWELVDALQQRNIPFSMMFFPNADHSIISPAAESVRWSFLLDALGLKASDLGASATP